MLQIQFDEQVLDDQKFQENAIENNLGVRADIMRDKDMGRLLNDDIGEPDTAFDGNTVWEGISKVLIEGINVKRDWDSLKPSLVLWNDFSQLQNQVTSLDSTLNLLTKAVRVVRNDNNTTQYLEANLIKFKNHYMKSYSMFKSHLDMLMKGDMAEVYRTTGNQYSGENLRLN